MEVLEKRTRYPLGYDDFEAFLRSQRAAEYLNFWADVRAHEQLCRTFEISERRLKREHQLEERAMARDRRRLALSHGIGRLSLDHDGSLYVQRTFNSHKSPTEQELNSSDPYITSHSNPESPQNDQLSFPPETRRYGARDSPTPMLASLSQRRGSEQRGATGAYNRLLTGGAGGRRSSLETSRQSLNDITTEHIDADPTAMTATSPINTRRRGSVDAIANAKLTGRKASVTVDYFGNGIRRSPSQQQLALQRSQHQSVQDGMAQLVEAVDDLLLQPGRSETCNHTPPPSPQMSQQSLRFVEPSLNRKPSAIRIEISVGSIQPPLAVRRSGDCVNIPSENSTIQDGRGAALLVQSYRTISMEDLEESALRIYRKYLVQLRTASMAAEEEAAANAAASKTQPDPTAALSRISIEKAFAPGWDGYAEQVIAEWNEKWRGRSAEARRSRRMSERRGTLGTASSAGDGHNTEEKYTSHGNTSRAETGPTDLDSEEKGELSDVESKIEEDDTVAGQDGKVDSMKPQRMKLDRTNTSTGITAFLSRLLRTETTVMELPTLTINTTTVTKDAQETEESEYDEDDEYDSDDIDEEEEPEEELEEDARVDSDRVQSELQAMVYGHDMDRLYANRTVEGSLSGDPLVSEAGTYGSAIQLQQFTARYPDPESTASQEGSRGARLTMVPNHQHMQELSSTSNPTTGLSTLYHAPAAFGTASTAPVPLTSSSRTRGAVAHSLASVAFYLPLECRQRIHTQIQQEGRTDGAHVFGPAKGFVIEVVLRDHYYPLFLKHVKHQNLSLLHRGHVNNWIKQSGAVLLGLALLIIVLAIQILLVMMNWGVWSRPWVWIVGVLGGWPCAIFLATGLTGFAPAVGLFGRIAEDRHVFRFRRILDPSIRSLHRKTALWMFSYCLFWALAVAVVFAVIPQRAVD
ncbi:hypothetical protein BGZ58_006887 [Dissophora ornata]|nr:hypothetical protein BGZ58_006887 [Dissophora ornata]